MKTKKRIPAAILFVILFPLSIQARPELPLNHKRLSDRVLVAWACDYMQMIDVVALATEKGIVVIEASLIRSEDARIRKLIEKEFGRKDFMYLINTHYHHDHTAGNQVYADATIIGHKTVPAGMRSELTGEGLDKLMENFHAMSKAWQEGIGQVEPGSRDHHFLKEGLIVVNKAITELQDGFIPTYPSILFEKNLILDMGDLHLELYALGGMHTESDIVIFVPEEGLVAVGDMTPDQMLPCLRKEKPWDMDLILENWGRIVDSGREIKHVNIAHSDMSLSAETFREQYQYFKILWEGLKDMHRRGMSLEEAKAAYTIERDFPYFKERITEVRGIDLHENNIEAMWERINEQ